MAALVALLGLGGWLFGGSTGLVIMVAIGLVANAVSYWFSDRIALAANRAQPLARDQAPRVYAIVERLTARAGLPMPPIYLIPTDSPNAFATGRNPHHAAVAVTRGLLATMNDRELAGVLAHEQSHVKNHDVLVATVAAGVAGVISTIGYVLQFGLMFGGTGDRDRDRGSPLAMLAWVIVAPLIALLLQLAISRSREYGADASGAELSGDPDGLADALEALERGTRRVPYAGAGPATAHLFIVAPLHAGGLFALLSTHPPLEARIARLRAMR